ncbi:MAG: site-specific DNA-methyltransferase [Vicinamibacterales bacterium]
MSDAYELSDAEKRDLIKLITKGKPLPEKYRFLLFADKREVELVWNGKTREVTTAVLPFQTLEHIDEPRKEKGDWQAELFDIRGRQLKGWTNKLIWGDNKLILSSLKSGALRRQIEDAGGLKLIYIDPPFDVGADFSMDIEIGGETFHKEPNLLEQIAYRDTWGRGADSFLAMLYERLILMRDLLAPDGSIYVHCDWRMDAFIRHAMDEVLGRRHFINEVVWKRTMAKALTSSQLPNNHDIIFSYSKTDGPVWNEDALFQPYDLDQLDEKTADKYTMLDETGRAYQLTSLLNPNPDRPNLRYEFMGVTRVWRWTRERMQAAMEQNLIVQPRPGAVPRYRRYLDEQRGKPLGDVWEDIPPVNSQAKERIGYPTQKPEALLERIIAASSKEGDLVADFFCGSGTTAAVAEKLNRKWIATDLGKFAIHTTRKRLIQVQRERRAKDETFRAFEVLNLGRYERQVYLNVSGRLTGKQKEQALARREQEFRDLILKAYRAEPLPDAGFFHGKSGSRLVVVGPINLPVGRLFVEEVITECRKRGATRVDVLAFEFEMGLFPAVLDEAKQKGIDLVPKTIPPEVFDKRAVERGQVRFHEVAAIEVMPRFDKGNPLALAVELTDFSVYYSQGLADSIAAELKDGKSEVVCEAGALIKISKDKQGVITRDVLTKHWTDWVDYWAVDFNYESRQEIIKVPKGAGINAVINSVQGHLPGQEPAQRELMLPATEFEDRWTGAYIFENEWQSFRTRQNRALDLTTAPHLYEKPGRYTVAVKVIDIFGNDTMTLMPITVG